MRMTALAADLRPRRFGKHRGTSRQKVAGKRHHKIVTTSKIFSQKPVPIQPSSPSPPLKSAAAPAEGRELHRF